MKTLLDGSLLDPNTIPWSDGTNWSQDKCADIALRAKQRSILQQADSELIVRELVLRQEYPSVEDFSIEDLVEEIRRREGPYVTQRTLVEWTRGVEGW